MAGKLSEYQANKVLNKLLRGEDYVVPGSYWIGAFKSANDVPLRGNVPGSASEVSASGYSRIEIRGATSLTFTQSTAGASQASGTVAWPAATALWGTVTYVAILDAATDGNVILYGALNTPKVVDVSDTFSIPAGLFTITL